MRRLVSVLAVLGALALSAAFAQETVVIAQQLERGSLNPADNRGLSDNTVMRVMMEGLVGFDQNLDLVPELAESWSISDDATEITFNLRQGVTFHDGTPFDAEQVKYYFDWARDPDNELGGRARSVFANVAEVIVMDSSTVCFILTEPSGPMIFNFATAEARLIPSTAIEAYGEDIGRNPVGTGPFRFVEWIPGQTVTVERYGDYWGEQAKVDRIEFRVVPNDATRIALLQSGEAHFIERVPPALVESLDADDDIIVDATGSVFARIFPMNTQIAPFDDVRVRQALNHAIDREQLVQVALQGFGTAMTSPMPASVFGHSPQAPYAYDLERARALLAEAGYPDGFTVEVLTFGSTEFTTVGQVLQQMLSMVGVTLELSPTERGALVERIFRPFEETDLEASLVGASTPTGDADRAMRQSFITESWPPAFNNWSFYSNPRVDELVAQGAVTGDQEERARIYAEAQEIVWNDAPWIFLYSPDNLAGRRSNVEGVFYMPPRYLDARNADIVE